MAGTSAQPFWQEIVRAGTYRLKDGQVYSPKLSDCKNMVEQGNGMLAAGLRVPFAWEHPPDALPSYNLSHRTEWLAKGYFGEPKEFKLDGDRVMGLMDVPDEKDREHFKKVKGVSPRVMTDFVDEKGKLWPGQTISHVAATPKPVQRDQQPAELSGTPDNPIPLKPAGALDLSGADYSENQTDDNTPKPSASSGKGNVINVGMIAGLIEKCGLKLGGNVADADDLCSRLTALAANMPKSGDPNDPDGFNTEVGDDDLTHASSGAGPMLMSQLSEGAKKVFKGVVERERKTMLAEVDDFVKKGAITPALGAEHKTELKVADLSFTEAGEIELTPVVVRHQFMRKLTPGNAFKRKAGGKEADLSQLEEAEVSHELDGDPVDQTEANAAARDAMLGRLGLTYAGKK